jgi:hypothetical protein
MEIVPVIAILVLAALGFGLMVSSVVMFARRHAPQPASPPGPVPAWPLWRRLFFAGAMLVLVASVLLLCPFVVPWWDYSSVWLQGVFVGFGLGMLYWGWVGPKFKDKRAG